MVTRRMLAAALALPLLAGAALTTTAMTATGAAAAPGSGVSGVMKVYKSPWCGCCKVWVDYVRAAGVEVEVQEVEDMGPVKLMAGVPETLQSCHTASIGGYVIEGHVPLEVMSRLLEEQPEVRGLSVPGMPVGSPGMEGPNPQPYSVISFAADGTLETYAHIEP